MKEILKHKKTFEEWKHFQKKGSFLTQNFLKQHIKNSWIRSQKNLKNKLDFSPDFASKEEVLKLKSKHKRLLEITKPYTKTIYDFVEGTLGAILISDEKGIVFEILGDNKNEFFPKYLNPGLIVDEEHFGTFSAGTALVENHAVQIWACEHYFKTFHEWFSASDTIHNKSGKIIACLTLILPWKQMTAHTLGMVAAVAGAIERQLIIEKTLEEKELLLNRQKTIMSSISDGICVLDFEGRIISLNDPARMILNVGINDIQGTFIEEIILSGFNFKKIVSNAIDIKDKDAVFKLKHSHFRCVMSATFVKNDKNKIENIVLNFREMESVNKFINKVTASQAFLSFHDIIGNSESFKLTIKEAKIAGRSNSNVLLLGQSGTGKELFAQSIHNYGDRKNEPFVALNCGALPRNLIESELFGYEGGAFTGSKKEGHPGKFELADKGTLFLDEIGDMPLEAQVNLLRVLETGDVTRIGGKFAKKVDVRIIAATNKDLQKAVKEKTFREDLFYRINVLTINIPPLKERKSDIKELTDFFTRKFSLRLMKSVTSISKEVYDYLEQYSWPGNIRELENVVERAVNIIEKNEFLPQHLPEHILSIQNEEKNKKQIEFSKNSLLKTEYETIKKILEKNKGNLRKTALELGIARSTLYEKIKKFNFDVREFRK